MVLMACAALVLPRSGLAEDPPKRVDYRIDFHWGGFSPYGSDDLGTYEDPTRPNPVDVGGASSSFDFDDVFGQPKGHSIGMKIWRISQDKYGVRFGYERDHYRADFHHGADTIVDWKVLKQDFSVEGTAGRRFGGSRFGFNPYLFGGISYVAYGETLVLSVQGKQVDSRDADLLFNAYGVNLGGGLQCILFNYVNVGVEIWHQWKPFHLTQGAQPDGSAKEFGARILFGFDLYPRFL